jgi:hypothetical protein
LRDHSIASSGRSRISTGLRSGNRAREHAGTTQSVNSPT